MSTLVTIVIPCYNHAQFLPDALESVLAQTYPHWECVVVNDASTDNTTEVAQHYADLDGRIQLVNAEKNSGLAASRNLGIAHSKGRLILPLDADDKLHPDYLLRTVPVMEKRPKLKLVFTDSQHFGAHTEIRRWKIFKLKHLCVANQLHCTALYRRKDYDQTQGYRTNMQYGYEDWDFWMQLLSHQKQIGHLPQVLFFVRAKQNAMHLELLGNAEKEQAMRQQLRLNNPDFFKHHHQPEKQQMLRRIWKKLFQIHL